MTRPARDDSLIRPRAFRPFHRSVNRRAFLFFQAPTLRKAATLGGYDLKKERTVGPCSYFPGKDRDDFGLMGPVVGAPAAAIAAEFLIALGCREIVSFGICGSLSGRLRIGQTVVPTGAVPEDGTSRLYLPGRERLATDPELTARVLRAARAAGLDPREAVAWTTDAFFRETAEKVQHFQRLGCGVVEMELAALCAVAEYRGARVASLLVVSDEVFGGKWKAGFLRPRFLRAVRLALSALLSLRG